MVGCACAMDEANGGVGGVRVGMSSMFVSFVAYEEWHGAHGRTLEVSWHFERGTNRRRY